MATQDAGPDTNFPGTGPCVAPYKSTLCLAPVQSAATRRRGIGPDFHAAKRQEDDFHDYIYISACLSIKGVHTGVLRALTDMLMPKLAHFSRCAMAAAASELPSPQNLHSTRMLLHTSTKLSRA